MRNVSFGGSSVTLEADASSTLYGAFADLASDIYSFDGWTMRSNVRGTIARQLLDGYAEGGLNPLRLAVSDADYDTSEVSTGIALLKSFAMPDGGTVTPRIVAGARYLAALGDRDIAVNFVQSGADALLEGDDRSVTQGYAGVGARFAINSSMSIDIDYTGRFGQEARDHALEARLNYRF